MCANNLWVCIQIMIVIAPYNLGWTILGKCEIPYIHISETKRETGSKCNKEPNNEIKTIRKYQQQYLLVYFMKNL